MNVPNLKAIKDWCVGKFQPQGDYLTEAEAGQMIDQAVGNISGGQDGFSPVIEEDPENDSNTYKLNITTKDGMITTPNLIGAEGQPGADGSDGVNGTDGSDGFSPVITENEDNTDSIYKLDITTAEGTLTTPNLKGADGGTTWEITVQTEEPETVAENEIVLVVVVEE